MEISFSADLPSGSDFLYWRAGISSNTGTNEKQKRRPAARNDESRLR